MTPRERNRRRGTPRWHRVPLLALTLAWLGGCTGLGPLAMRPVALPFALESAGAMVDDPRFVMRDRLDLAGPSRRAALRGTSFSHRSRRYHVYPFTSYGASELTVALSVRDPRMRERAALWVLGPRRADGSWAAVASARGPAAALSVQATGLAQYVAIVGPATPGGFLPRYPGVEALLELETDEGSDEELASLETRADGVALLHFAGEADPEFEPLAGRRFRIFEPVTAADSVAALGDDPFGLLFAEECADARCAETQGDLLTFAPRAWTRYQLFAPEDADSLDDTRLAALNEPQEGYFTVFTPTSPHRPEASFQILEAVGADGRPDFEDPALLRVVPLAFGACEVDVVVNSTCDASAGHCRSPVCLGGGPLPADLPIRAYRATALDIDETSLYDIEARCEGSCAPTAAPTRYPVYLAHGFNSSKEVWDDVRARLVASDPRWQQWLEAESVPGFEPVERRTQQLRRNLAAHLRALEARGTRPPEGEPFQKLNVIAHSMGGLDSRMLVGAPIYNHPQCHERLECTDVEGRPEPCCSADAEGRAIPWRARIASVTTLSTPHRGSSFADVGMTLLESRSIDWAFRKAARYILGLDSEEEQQHLRETLFTLSSRFAAETMTPNFPPVQPRRVYAFACATGEASCDDLPRDADLPPGDGRLPPPNGSVTFFGWASESCVTGSCGSIVDPGLALSYGIVKQREGPGDGVVAIQSARFGVYMGVRANDHFHWNRLSFAGVVDLAARAFGIKREPVDRFYRHWLGTLSRSGY